MIITKKLLLFCAIIFLNFIFSQESKYDLFRINPENLKLYNDNNSKISFIGKDSVLTKFYFEKGVSMPHFEKTAFKKKKIIDSLLIIDNKTKPAFININGLIFKNFNFDDTFIYIPNQDILIDDNNRKISLNNILEEKYGSISNLKEELLKRKIDIKNLKRNDVDLYYKTDFGLYEKYFPKDSIKVIELLIKDIDTAIKLNENEKELIYKVLKEKKFLIKSLNTNPLNIYFYGCEITPILFLILDDEKVFKYLKLKHQQSSIKNVYRQYIYNIYNSDKSSARSFDEYLKEYIHKITSN